MSRNFTLHLLFILLLNGLVKPLYILGIDAEMINVLGQEHYGVYFTLMSFCILFGMLQDLGINQYNTTSIAKDRSLFQAQFSSLLGSKLILSLGFVAICTFLGWLWGYQENTLLYLIWIAVNQGLSGVLLFLRSNLGGLHMYRKDSILSVADKGILIVIVGAILWVPELSIDMTLEWFLGVQTFAFCSSILLSYKWLFPHLHHALPSWDKRLFISTIQKSLPYALLVFLMSMYYRIDSIMLENILPNGFSAAGEYAQAYRIFEAGNMIAFLFATLLLPMFAQYSIKAKEVAELVKTAFPLLYIGAFLGTFLGGIYSHEIMAWRYITVNENSGMLLLLLLGCFFCVAQTYILGTLLTAHGFLGFLNILSAGALLLNVALNAYCIPKYGVLGSAWASLATQVLVISVQWVYCVRVYHWKINTSLLVKILLFSSLAILSSFAVRYGTGIAWGWQLLLSFLAGAIVAWSTGLFSLKNILHLLRSR